MCFTKELTHHKDGVHGLGNVEGMSPVVVSDRTIVLFDCEHPLMKNLTPQRRNYAQQTYLTKSIYCIALIFRGSLILRILRIWNRSQNSFN